MASSSSSSGPTAAGAGPTSGDVVARARSEFQKKNVICDSEGFYQHMGECWNDALQMIFLFCDGFKELSQKFLLDISPTDESSLRALYGEKDATFYKFLVPYLVNTQRRFSRHYLIESEKRNLASSGPVSVEALQAISKRPNYRAKGKEGIATAAAGKQQNTCEYTPGGKVIDEARVIEIFRPAFTPGKVETLLFFPNYSDKYFTTYIGEVKNLREIPLETFFTSESQYSPLAVKINIEIKDTSQHVACFITCGGIDYFYEDIFGLITFPWRACLRNMKPFTNLVFWGKLKKQKIGTKEIYVTHYYPILERGQKGSHEKTYYAFFDNDPEPLQVPINKKTSIEKNGFIYTLEFYAPFVYNMFVNTFVLFHLTGLDIPKAKGNTISFGSRIPQLQNAIEKMNKNMFDQSFTPELFEELKPKIERHMFEPNDEHGDYILTKLHPYLRENEWSERTKHLLAIEMDYPMLLQDLYDKNPSLRNQPVFKKMKPIHRAIVQNKPKVLSVICEVPIPKENYEEAVEFIESVTDDAEYAAVVEAFKSCSPAAEGGRYKQTRRRSSKGKGKGRKTRRYLRKVRRNS